MVSERYSEEFYWGGGGWGGEGGFPGIFRWGKFNMTTQLQFSSFCPQVLPNTCMLFTGWEVRIGPVNNIFIFFLLIFKSFRERQGLGPRTDDVLQLLQLAKRSPYDRRYDADKNSSNWRKCQICRNYVYSRELYSLHT